MKICVGSKNHLKIKAVKEIAKDIWEDLKIISIDADSGVSNQPTSNQEAIIGAENRAKQCLEKTDCNLGIGIEGGVHKYKYGYILNLWAFALDRKGNRGIGAGSNILLPKKIGKEIDKGKELGPIMDKVINTKNIKLKEGTLGILTKNKVSRKEGMKQPIICALSRFYNSDIYKL